MDSTEIQEGTKFLILIIHNMTAVVDGGSDEDDVEIEFESDKEKEKEGGLPFGSVVLAHLKGYPPWPAWVSTIMLSALQIITVLICPQIVDPCKVSEVVKASKRKDTLVQFFPVGKL